MSDDPLSDLARTLLCEAARETKGARLSGKEQKAAAAEIVRRGFGAINRSATRLTALPAGKFVAENWRCQ